MANNMWLADWQPMTAWFNSQAHSFAHHLQFQNTKMTVVKVFTFRLQNGTSQTSGGSHSKKDKLYAVYQYNTEPLHEFAAYSNT